MISRKEAIERWFTIHEGYLVFFSGNGKSKQKSRNWFGLILVGELLINSFYLLILSRLLFETGEKLELSASIFKAFLES
jgi:hypothetical protein